MFYYSVVNLLRIAVHYSKCSKSVESVVIRYFFSSESLRVVHSLQIANSLCILFFVCHGPLAKGAYSPRGRSKRLLETTFSEPHLRTLLRNLIYCKTQSEPPSKDHSENLLQNPFQNLRNHFSEPFFEACAVLRPLRRAPYMRNLGSSFLAISPAFPQILMDFQSISVTFSHFWSLQSPLGVEN